MPETTIGIHSPGDMGAAVGRVLREHGLRVIAALEGRSPRTRDFASEAGIEDVGTLEALTAQADQVLSILVPDRAEEAAGELAAAMATGDARPLVVDCNAIAAGTAGRIGRIVTGAGARFVDASIIGPPPRKPGVTRFYASGADAEAFAALAGHGLDIRVLDGPIGRASAIKTSYAALTKGLMALGTELLVSAHAHGLLGPLLEEFQTSQPALLAWLERTVPNMPPKAHRFIGEMEEHGQGFADQGLTPLMMQGAADFYRFTAQTPLGQETTDTAPRRELETIIAELAVTLAGG